MRRQRNERLLARRRRRHRDQEGAALLVVMIIIAITTAAAAISVQNTTVEMHAAGRERILTQTRYASEAAMQTTLAYIDLISPSGFEKLWTEDFPAAAPPEMRAFTGGHQITAFNRHHAALLTKEQQELLAGARLLEPVSGPDETLAIPDLTGSFGPGQPYSMEDYVVDITDCFKGPPIPGDNINVGGMVRFFCTLTVRGRVSMNDESGAFVSWDLPGGFNGVPQERSGGAHDLRVTIETVPVPDPGGGNQ